MFKAQILPKTLLSGGEFSNDVEGVAISIY